MSLLAYTLVLRDQLSRQMRTIEANTNSSLRSMTNAQRRHQQGVNATGVSVRGLSSSVKGLGAAGAVAAGILTALVVAADKIVDTFMPFEQKLSNIRALTQSDEQATLRLKDAAMLLGRQSIFTASDVAELEINLLKFGFTAKETEQSISGIIAAAEATGTTLQDMSAVGAATLRGFQLDASQMGRVADVMSLSFVKSALDLEKFRESVKYIAPVAQEAGFSLEQTTAMVSALADAGISGSMAGTSLRRIISDVSIIATKEGISASEAFDRLAREGINIADAFDEVGRTAQTSLLILSKNKDKVNELTEAYNNAAGSAAEMSRVMKDNLAGDIMNLESSWEGLILSIESGDGVLSKFFRNMVTGLDDVIYKITRVKELTSQGESLSDAFEKAGYETLQRESIRENQAALTTVKKAVSATGFEGTLREFLLMSDVKNAQLRNEVRAVIGYDTEDIQNKIAADRILQNMGFGKLAESLFGNKVDEVLVTPDGTQTNTSTSTGSFNSGFTAGSAATTNTRNLEGNMTNLSRQATVKQINLNIDKLVGIETLSTTNLQGSTAQLEDAVKKVLLRSLTDVTAHSNFN